ncbi:MAG: hypothetical protein IKV21_00675 [Clostridia bacterium]|nr:hypothetical protein [Clostridia bacterium]
MKNAKKLLSILLAVLMIFSVSSIAFAAEASEPDCPVIHIPGFYSADIYADVENPETLIALPTTEEILELVKTTVVPALAVFSVSRDTDALATDICAGINVMFEDWFNESTGEAKEGSGIIFSAPTVAAKDSKYTFRYDWRSDPVIIAQNLSDYIDAVISLSDSETVALSCHSLGSSIALAYLTEFGNEKIDSIIFDSPACSGVAVVGNLLTGEVTLDGKAVATFLKTVLGESEYESLLASVLDIFEMAEIPELFTLFVDEIIEILAPAVYKKTLAPLFGYWPTIWSMVPDAKLDQAKAYIFDEILKDEDLSVLKEKIEAYDAVREKREETLTAFDEKGTFAILSRYGSTAFPLNGSSDLVGDSVIETCSSSLGATTAPLGNYFSDAYLEGKDMDYISPDRTIDASTCLFPEKTWFIKNSGHFETHYTDDYYDFFLFAEEELTCNKTEFGRFCTFETENYTLVKDTSEPQKAENSSPLTRLFTFLAALFEHIGALLKKLFA